MADGFDPRAHIQKKLAAKGFDPKAYIQQKLGSAPVSEKDIIQETHPDVSVKDRLIVKNFSNDPDQAVEYLKNQYPDKDIKFQGGNYLIKDKKAQAYNVLDPDTGFFSSDMLADAGDIAYDTVAGIGSGLATTAGALGGAVTTGGVGAVPGAMAASGASSAALEALRQYIGKQAGVNKEIKGGDVALSGGVGLAAPLVFGAGAPAKTAVKMLTEDAVRKAAVEGTQALTEAQVKEQLKNYSRGLIGRAYDTTKGTVLPKIGEFVNSTPAQTIKTYAERMPEVEQLEKEGVTGLIDNIQSKVVGDLGGMKRKAGETLGQEIDKAGGKVNIAGVKQLFKDQIDKLNNLKGEIDNPYMIEKIESVQKTFDKLFGRDIGERKVVGSIKAPGQEAIEGGTRTSAGSVTVKGSPAVTPEGNFGIDLNTMKAANTNPQAAVPDINIPIVDDTTQNFDWNSMTYKPKTTRPGTPDVQIPIVDDPTTQLDWTTMQMKSTPKEISDELSGRAAFQLQQDLKDIADFARKEGNPMTMGKATAHEKEVSNIASKAYGMMNEELERVTAGSSPKLKGQYRELTKLQESLEPYFKDPQRTYNALSGLDAKSRKILVENLTKLRDKFGVDIKKDVELLEAYAQLGRPDATFTAGGAAVKDKRVPLAGLLATLGSLAGYKLGGGYAGAAVGGGLGFQTGMALGGRNAVRGAVKAGKAIESVGKELAPIVPSPQVLTGSAVGATSAWKNMPEKQRRK